MDIAKIRTALKAITLGIGFSIAAPAFGATGELLLRTGSEPGAACREVGNQVFVEVQVDNLSDAINGIQASMTYDDSVIALNIAASTEEAGWTLISLTDSGGSVLYAVIRLGGSVGPLLGTPTKVATLVFDVVDHGSTAIQLQNSNTLLTTSAMDPEIINGANLTRVDSGLVSVDGASAGNNGPVCEGTALSLSATVPDEFANPPYTFVWAGPDGFNSTDQSPEVSASATLAMAGAYTVTVTNDDGCEFVAETVVTVNASPTPTITSDPGETVCAGTTVTLDAGAGYASYLWSPGGEITQTIEVTSSGTYSVTVTDGSGCTGSDDITITVNANPTVTITSDPGETVCAGTTVTLDAGAGYASYLWSPGGEITQTIEVTSSGTYSVTVTDGSGCTGSDDITITVNASLSPTITSDPGETVCAGTTVTLDAGAGYASYLWSPGGEITQTIEVTSSGTYSVTVTDGSGCTGSDDITITVNANPTVTITSDPGETVCAGTTVTLDAGAGYASYLWSPGGEITQTIEVTSSGTYSVTVTDGSGCTGSDDITITVNTNPTANAGLDIDVCLGEINPVIGGSPTAAGGEGPYTYAWTGSGASFLDDPGDANPTFDVSAAGIGSHLICVVVTDLNACISASDCATVEVQPCLTVNLTIQGLSGDPNNNPTPYGAPGGADLTRVVEFVLTDCGLPMVADNRAEPVTFAPDGTDGSASVVLRNVSTDAVWLSAREGHTLRRLVPVNLSSGTDVVAMTLISGDVRTATVMQDGLIDIVDFSILASRWNENIAADLSIGADVNGDGKQNTNDFTAMQINYFMTGDEVDGCGGMGAIGLPDVPTKPGTPIKRGKKEVSVRRLSAIAPDAVSADITGDGMVDSRDIRRFAEIHNLPILPEFEAKLRRLENGDSIRLITP